MTADNVYAEIDRLVEKYLTVAVEIEKTRARAKELSGEKAIVVSKLREYFAAADIATLLGISQAAVFSMLQEAPPANSVGRRAPALQPREVSIPLRELIPRKNAVVAMQVWSVGYDGIVQMMIEWAGGEPEGRYGMMGAGLASSLAAQLGLTHRQDLVGGVTRWYR